MGSKQFCLAPVLRNLSGLSHGQYARSLRQHVNSTQQNYTTNKMGEWEAGSYFCLRWLRRACQGDCLTYGDGKMPSPCSGQYSGVLKLYRLELPSPPKWRGVCASSLLALLYPNHPFKQATKCITYICAKVDRKYRPLQQTRPYRTENISHKITKNC